jgi:DNA-binding MarR family transcriptional regulator
MQRGVRRNGHAGPTLRLQHFVPYRLSVLANTVSAAIAGAYAERFDLTIPEWRVIAVLAMEAGLSAAEVGQRTAMDKVAVSRAVTRLLRSRRVVRAFADHDRRRSVLRLSRSGAAVYRRVVPFARRYERTLLAELSTTQRAQFDALLEHLQRRASLLGPVRPV